MISVYEWAKLKADLHTEAVATEQVLADRIDRLKTLPTRELSSLLEHWSTQVSRMRMLDGATIKKRNDAETWVQAINYVLEHPELAVCPPATMQDTIRADNMTADEAASYLRIPKSSLYKGTSSSKIPHRKVGRLLRFSREELDKYLGGRQIMTDQELDEAANTKLGELSRKRKA